MAIFRYHTRCAPKPKRVLKCEWRFWILFQ
jgi:hypothetical protein